MKSLLIRFTKDHTFLHNSFKQQYRTVVFLSNYRLWIGINFENSSLFLGSANRKLIFGIVFLFLMSFVVVLFVLLVLFSPLIFRNIIYVSCFAAVASSTACFLIFLTRLVMPFYSKI